jgi:hypothetical protein
MRFCNAFTSIGLLTVIAIIALLAGVLFPVFATARESERKIVCLSNLRQIGIYGLYAQEYGTVQGSWNFGASKHGNTTGMAVWRDHRYNALHVDGHAKNIDQATFVLQWSMGLSD